MPRSTPKSRHNVNGHAYGLQTTASSHISNVVSKTTPIVSKRGRTVKKEPGSGTETNTEQVFHRKSERRRVARDIFLVFEEQPSARRSRGSNKKQAKPKFGHLKVEDPIKQKGLLRDIKNEPKCYFSNNSTDKSLPKETSKRKCVDKDRNANFNVWSSSSCQPCSSICPKSKSVAASKVSQNIQVHSNIDDFPVVARVNPIFLWAKQDNSRIIEVRCEDYDKRNRIRITKTSNGWRAIPRSDPTSSKVIKLYTSPLIKVKRENHINVGNHISQTTSATNFIIENKPVLDISNINTLRVTEDTSSLTKLTNGRTRKASAKKSKKKKSKKRKKSVACENVALRISGDAIDKSQQAVSPKTAVDFVSDNNCPPMEFYDKDIAIEKRVSIVKEDCSPPEFIVPAAVDGDVQQNLEQPLRAVSPYNNPAADAIFVKGTFNDDSSFQLCPKTGFFLRNTYEVIENGADNDIESIGCNSNNAIDMDRSKKSLTENRQISIEEIHESLEAKTRNLKDLLDDADLFQHCDDNANSDADLIDTLVKSSCENNLLQDNESNDKEALEAAQSNDVGKTSTGGEDLAQLITDVSEPPKCLSFNEAGEIEALNCELFQPNAYMDTFEKQTPTTISETQLSMHVVTPLQSTSMLVPQTQDNLSSGLDLVNSDKSSYGSANVTEDSPKDLSYKKREEVCPPSESRSQCAVTSSSDVVKSPNHDDSSALASSSETLKNLILEQFIKLNTISTHKKNPIALDKQAKTLTHLNSLCPKNIGSPSHVIETVIIDDDDSAVEANMTECEAEPLKKRLRSTAVLTQQNSETDINKKTKLIMMDRDPDPLTQLRLLIQNSQWKVPDPILVPKDRLSAVLASPAREIPLLITTRPELRLPEAFAYPEIIQNPNILVISMAQLEAILKNDQEINKFKVTDQDLTQASSLNFKSHSSQNQKFGNGFQAQTQQREKQPPSIVRLQETENGSTSTTPNSSLSKEDAAKCSHIGSSVSSDINAATMAVLNQMLWLPYFGQISQDFIKTIKTPHGLTEKMASILPYSGAQNLESMCEKNTQTSLSLHQAHSEKTGVHYGNAVLPTVLKQGQMEEMTLFQKVLQQQIQNAVNISQAKNSNIDRLNVTPIHSSAVLNSHVENALTNHPNNNSTDNKQLGTHSMKNNKVADQTPCNTLDVAGKTYNLRSSIASRQGSDSNQYSNMKRNNPENKPRVTCKSLSNLLDPEHSQPHNMSLTSNPVMPVVSNVENNFLLENSLKSHVMENKNNGRVREITKESKVLKSLIRSCSNNSDIPIEYSKQNNKMVEEITSETGARSVEPTMLPVESNAPLWHPLFGSNTKSAYSSPWQWTTVTAAGE